MKKALTHDTRICQIVEDGEEFEVHSSLTWVSVPDDTTVEDTWVDNDVVKFTLPDPTMESLRLKRNILLLKSDWTQISDATVNKTDWATYRQQLRDLPENTPDLSNIVWPTPPA
tara:strand:- start:4115 stop:4456 length:342 start_codon:yes stop_codon:yes gene_type:complete